MRRWLVILLATTLVLAALAVGAVDLLFRWRIRPKLEAYRAVQVQHLQLYLDDLDYLARFTDLREVKTGRADAGPFLNPLLHWQPSFKGHHGAEKPIVSHEIREQILRLGGDWIRKHGKSKKMPADLSFFTSLERYDFWDIEVASPIADIMKEDVFIPPPQLPVPEVSDILALSKLRLMRGAEENDPLQALKDTRQLARLLMTTENVQLVLAAVAVMDDERKAYRYYVDEMDFPRESWQPVDRNTTRRAYRAILATRGYLRLWTNPEQLQRIFLSEAKPVGLCAAANEAFPLEFAVRPLLAPHLPFEMDLRQQYRTLDTIFARVKEQCRVRYLSDRIAQSDFSVPVPGPFLLNRLPYARKIFGLNPSLNSFGGFDAYSALDALGPEGG